MTNFRYLILAFLFGTSVAWATIMRLERAFPAEYDVDLIAIHANRVLVKPDSGVALNTDFILRFSSGDGAELRCAVAGTLFGFAASESLSTAAIEWIGSAQRLDIVALLDTAQVSERLVIGLPECLRPLAYDLSPALATDSGSYEFRFYNSAQDAEIERQLGRWDIYIVPETEVEAESAVVLLGVSKGEWHLLVRDDVDDLAATAVNYCVKGALGDAGSPEFSTIINREDIASIFPRNVNYATGLFADLKKSERISGINFESADQLPGTAALIAGLISSCQGHQVKIAKASESQTTLCFSIVEPYREGSGLIAMNSNHIEWNADSQLVIVEVIDAIPVLATADKFARSWREGLGSKIFGNLIEVSCDSLLSHSLSERCRIIPLGRTRLVARLGIHTRCLQLPGRPATLRHFYSKAR